MNLLSIEQVSKSYGEKVLFDQITMGIEDTDKIGLIGVNGTGKSSFLKVIAGLDQPDSGKVSVGNSVTIQYLSQNPEFDTEATVLQQVFNGTSQIMQTLREYGKVMQDLEERPNEESVINRMLRVNQEMDRLDAWQLESDAKTILTKLGVVDFDAKIGTLSGGQRKRVALSSALIHPCDLLILDEPTNHIDNESVDWLEQYLNKRKGALIMITHDRYFLDRVVNRIIELDRGRLFSYAANYTHFLELKMDREERELASEHKRQNLLRTELAWIRRGAKARSTKQKARIDRFEKLQDEGLDVRSDQVDISVGASRLGKKIVELEHVYKKFGERQLIADFSYTAVRDDRIGIIGPNGGGKSTLLNLIAGRLQLDAGSIELGPTVKLGYFSQENTEINGALRVIEYIKEAAEVIYTAGGEGITAAEMLERFLFSPTMQWTPISKLSGGEKRRLFLLRVLMTAPNVLLLDEPTNDLDIQTLTVLEQYLDDFPGVVIAVSHDRYFLDRVVEKIFAFQGEGRIVQHVGNYSEYQEYQARYLQEQAPKVEVKVEEKPKVEERREKTLKFSYKELKEYESIDGDIAAAEAKLVALGEQMNSASSDSMLLQKLVSDQKEMEQKLEELFERWTYLNELAEQIEQGRKG